MRGGGPPDRSHRRVRIVAPRDRPGCARAFLGLIALLTVMLAVRSAGAEAPPPPVTGVPVRLVLPAIGVDADVETFDLADDGTMPVPQTASLVAWYTFSARAGAPGNAVLAGHRDWQRRRGAFYSLGAVQEGDEVWLQDGRGAWYLYAVDWSASVPDDDRFIEELVGPATQPFLTLITCSGVFDRTTGRYVERHIVRAELVMVVGVPDTAAEDD